MDTIRKRRVTFYGHMKRINGDRLKKNIFDFFDKPPRCSLIRLKRSDKI